MPRLSALLPVILPLLTYSEVVDFAGLAIPMQGQAHIAKFDDALDQLIDARATIYKLAEGFIWSEGPVWVNREGGFLLFSDTRSNSIYRYREGQGIDVYLVPSGYTGATPRHNETGSNGLFLDNDGNLLICQHGNRVIARYSWAEAYETVASHYNGKHLNSPNDMDVDSSGAIYFTDPPYGIPLRQRDELKEQPHNGIYRVDPDGKVTLLDASVSYPNGIALSPDERTLYVNQSTGQQPVTFAFDVKSDSTLENKRIFYDHSDLQPYGRFACDGMTVDIEGNVWTTSPMGVSIISPEGILLGTIVTRVRTANCTFGGPDKSVLYITADSYLLRVQTRTQGK